MNLLILRMCHIGSYLIQIYKIKKIKKTLIDNLELIDFVLFLI